MLTDSSRKHVFSSDKPVVSSSEDLLQRVHFSVQLSKSLANWDETESLVVGLYGRWGDGKTSVKNMMLEYFLNNSSTSIEIFEFNPWQWSHKDSLIDSFFGELIRRLSKTDERMAKELIAKLSDYYEYLKLADELVAKMQSSLRSIFYFLALGAGLCSINLEGKYFYVSVLLAVTLIAFGQSLKIINWFLSFYLRWKNIRQHSKSLEEKKKDISRLLEAFGKTFLVIIDDVDRLAPDEVKNLFTLIKANADFPKLVYMTLFQRDIVERSLEKAGVYSGGEYLEKIVQVAIDLPDIPPEGVHRILFNKLDRTLEDFGGDKNFDSGRWSELYLDGISGYFKNLRDVNRFVSSLSFQMGSLYKHNVLEVNSIDLIGVEVLRHFEPAVHKSLFDNKKILTKLSSSRNYSESTDKEAILRIFELAGQERREQVQHIIKVLFPNVQWAWSNYSSSVDDEDFIKLRICHPDRFNRYFSYFMSPDEFSQYEYEDVLKNCDNSEALTAILMEYHHHGRLTAFLSKFESYKQKVAAEHAHPFLCSMLEIGEVVSDEHRGFFQFSSLLNLKRIISWYLRKKEFKDNRKEVFKRALEETKGISLPIMELKEEYDRREADKYPDSYSFQAEDKEMIGTLLLNKIEGNKNLSIFKSSIHLPRIMLIWGSFDKPAAQEWLRNHLKPDEVFVSFCNKLLAKSFTSVGYETKTNYSLSTFYLTELFNDPKAVIARLRSLKESYSQDDYVQLFKLLNRAEDELDNPEKYKNRSRGFDEDE